MEYDEFESLIVHDIISQYPEYAQRLKKQFDSSVIAKRTIYPCAFITEYSASATDAVLDGAPDLRLGNSQWNIDGLTMGSDYILWIRGGYISSLEGFSYGEPWPSEIKNVVKIKS